MLWIILFGLFFAFLLWILISPIYLHIEWNDARRVLQLHWWGLLRARLAPEAGRWAFRLEAPFFTRSWSVAEWWTSGKKADQSKKGKARKKSWKPRHPRQLVYRLWRSFHLIRFHWELDTGDYVWNAYLFPLFRVTNPAGQRDWRINFQGRNDLLLIVENRLYRLVYALLRTAF
ncbi:hypothetical protein [Flavilitoribacter nigricans]|uniref:DUF2953 domain-containing protein n=1 Tax=Flavilitoribacter nigricans (strain ATCC 23147 / DSM 23189 / NBRC 102662 / NCIMB 1420 / SS-2) TaxID=1122177 RepID=A0A2D0N007_FLAN2|nr:hypothetical protein [Flavilitoribacter nigricans]PHN01706.1 hypothetical protein CRP01_35760 [Flavilitoribacter nigricans DSM 23189 = NBRC 102662]